VLKLAGEIGFDGVEIRGGEPHMSAAYDAARVKRVRDLGAESGVTVGVFGSYIRPLMDNFESASRHCLDIAVGLGAPVVRVWAPRGAAGSLGGAQYSRAVAQQRDFCKRAEEMDLVLAIESHDGYIAETSEGMLQLIKDVGADNLKVNWQPSFSEHADDPCESLSALMPYTVNVHAQNFSGPTGERRRLADGAVDYARVIAELKNAGFNGYVEIEFAGEGDAVEWIKKDFDYLNRLIKG